MSTQNICQQKIAVNNPQVKIVLIHAAHRPLQTQEDRVQTQTRLTGSCPRASQTFFLDFRYYIF